MRTGVTARWLCLVARYAQPVSPTRTAQGFPWVVASLCGFVVAIVSGATGVVAHWLASTGPMPVTADAVIATVAACTGVGILTTAGVGRFHPGLIVPAGLVAAQGSVHHALEWTHRLHGPAHGAGDVSGHAAHLLYTPAEQAAMTREAMTAGAHIAAGAAGHGAPSWSMLAAHAVATVVAAGALALVAGVLGWLVARAEQLTIGHLCAVDRASTVPPANTPRAASDRFLLSRGLLRGPPVARGAWS